MKNEIWKPITDYEGRYIISNLGRIKSLKAPIKHGLKNKNKFKKPHITKHGYLRVTLYRHNKGNAFHVHRLMLIAFNPIENYDNYHVAHINGNSKDNRLENLQWATPRQNEYHKLLHGRRMQGSKHHKAILDENDVLFIRELKNTITRKEFTSIFNVSIYTIDAIISRRNWRHI